MAAKLNKFFDDLFRQRDLITRKFYLVILLFVVIVFCLVLLNRFQAHIIDSVRAYVAAEGLWSKGQKDAVYHLEHYAETYDKRAYAKYLEALSAALGDRKARLALQADPPDIEQARQGFLEGRNHPDDIDNMISLFLNFGEVSYMKEAINIWSEGDLLIDELMHQGDELDAEIGSDNPAATRLRAIMGSVAALNTQLREVEDQFSATLGDAARKIEQLTKWVITIATLLLLTIGVFLSRQILHGIRETQRELQQLEEHLRESQKMETIGTLVGGIAHDFNNTLAAIQGNLYLTEKQMSDEHPKVRERLQIIKKLSDHSAEIVRQLMAFAHKDIVQMSELSLNGFFKELESLIPPIIPANISFKTKIDTKELWIHADTTQLQQMIFHLLNNARDAVEDVDTPLIEVQLTASKTSNEPLAEVIIRDNGCGIPAEDMEHIFEPFYTTKEVGKGTGLGLSMVYGAMQRHQGSVEIKSEVGAGTSVHLYFPLVKQLNKEVFKKPVDNAANPSHSRTILLVDDDINLRTVCEEALKNMGHAVLSAKDGSTALECFNQHQNEIELVITDIVMPNMGGFELANHLRQLNNNLPLIFITGYDPKQTDLPENLLRNSVTLHKPFSMETLEHALIETDTTAD